MRRFSQRNSLVTLSDINITPLLDLAFVLLIIFVITTPLLEKGLDVKLPSISGGTEVIRSSDVRTVEVGTDGQYFFQRQKMPLDQVVRNLAAAKRANPRLVVDIRADKDGHIALLTDLMDRCQQLGITQMSVRGNPRSNTP
jgi:biopolymer transport protein ExbD